MYNRIVTVVPTLVPGLILLACLAGLTGTALADASSGRDAWRYNLSVATFHLPETGLDAGGKTALTTYHFQAGVKRRIMRGADFGLVFSYGHYDRRFSGADGFAALRPWDDIGRVGLNASLRVHASDIWTFGVRPFISSFSESGNVDSDSLSYGVALAVASRLSSDRHIGLGMRVADQIDDSVKVIPFVVVDWRFNNHWRLRNPSEPGLIGSAGLKLGYEPGNQWEFAVIGVYHSPEFRLDERGVAPGGIGEHDGIIGLVRLDRRWGPDLTFKGYVGAVFEGSLKVRDAEGRLVARSDFDTTALAGLALEKSF